MANDESEQAADTLLNPAKKVSQGTIVLVLICLAAVIAGIEIGLHNPLFSPAVSVQGRAVDRLFNILLGISTVVFVIVVATLVYIVFYYGKRRHPAAVVETRENRYLHLAWTIIPIILVIFMGTYSYLVLAEVTKPQANELTVKVTAKQWSWEFYYPDAGVTSSELHIPVNHTVLLSMRSEDVIHSFWVPQFRIKQDILPDRETTLLVTPNTIGTYPLVCNHICGVGHSSMLTNVVIQTQSDFEAWITSRQASQSKTATQTPAP